MTKTSRPFSAKTTRATSGPCGPARVIVLSVDGSTRTQGSSQAEHEPAVDGDVDGARRGLRGGDLRPLA